MSWEFITAFCLNGLKFLFQYIFKLEESIFVCMMTHWLKHLHQQTFNSAF